MSRAGGGRPANNSHKPTNAGGGGGRSSSNEELGLPRLIARIWGLVAGGSFVSNGGYLLVQVTDQPKCQGAGGYMICIGLIIIVLECACCLCPAKNNCCDKFEEKVPFWVRTIYYILLAIPPLALCSGVKTVISSLIVIMEGIIYGILYCLVRSNKYERLREASAAEYKRRQNEAAGYGTVLSTANNAMNFFKETSAAAAQKQQGAKGAKAGGGRPKKPKPRSVSSV